MYRKQLIVLTPESKISTCDMVNFWICSDCKYIRIIHPTVIRHDGTSVQPTTLLHFGETIISGGLYSATDYLMKIYDDSTFRLVNMEDDIITFERLS